MTDKIIPDITTQPTRLDCGCLVVGDWVDFCPTHAAAPALLAACEAYVDHVQPSLHDDEGWKLLEAVTEALAAARQEADDVA